MKRGVDLAFICVSAHAQWESSSMLLTRLQPFILSLIGGGARVFQIASSLIFVTLLINYLDPEQFVIWLAATSLMSLARFIDLGMGGCLVNQIASVENKDSHDRIHDSVSSAFFGLAFIGTFAAALLALAYPYMPWEKLLGLPAHASEQASGPVLFYVLLSLCAIAPLSIVGKIRLGLHQFHIHNLWEATTYALTLLAIAAGIYFGVSLSGLVLMYCFIPVLVQTANYIAMVRKIGGWVAPRFRSFRFRYSIELLRNGRFFFFNSFVLTLCFSIDSFIAIHVLDVHAATEFGLGQRLALAAQHIISIMLIHFWPLYQRALSSGDFHSGRRAIWQAIALALVLALPASGIIATAGEFMILVWTRGAVVISHNVLLALAVWVPVFALGTALSSFMNAPATIRIQLQISVVSGFAALAIKTTLALWFGAAGIIWGNIIGYGLFAVVPVSLIIWHRSYHRASFIAANQDAL